MDIQQTIEYVEKQFLEANLWYGHGTDNAWDEAVQLVLFVMQLPAGSGDDVLPLRVSDEQYAQIKQLVTRRVDSREPLPYITHEAWFAGMPFYVDRRVLIPRSPFGELIENQFAPWVNPDQVLRILEIGTGSGCMAIAAAHHFPAAQVDAVDVSREALDVAKINVEKYQLQDRVHLIESDCFESVPKQSYDIIMSNPPYVSAAEMETLPKEYQHEPSLALEAPEEGLAIVENMLSHYADYLSPNGILVVEVGNSADLLAKKHPDIPFIWLELERGGHGVFVLSMQ